VQILEVWTNFWEYLKELKSEKELPAQRQGLRGPVARCVGKAEEP
jgi:hypothetical protein